MTPRRNPTASSLRKLLDAVFPSSSDFDAFVLDHYRDVHLQLSTAMDRTQRVSKLLESQPPAEVLERLCQAYPELVAQWESLLIEDTGRRILKDEFELHEVLRNGPMSKIYRAWQRTTNAWRVVKELKVELSDAQSQQRFKQEVLILGKLQANQHIVQIIDADVDDHDRPWLAMELLTGESLAAYLSRRGPLGQDESYRILSDVCKALSAAHSCRPSIVHRDLKPENIFLHLTDQSGDTSQITPYKVKLLDFGLAKVLWESRSALSSHYGIGTPLWMAPEQFDVNLAISPATDVWAFGLLAFRIITGFHYFPEGNQPKPSTSTMAAQISRGVLVLPSARACEFGLPNLISAGFDRWFARCVCRDVTSRYQNASEAMNAFKAMVYSPQRVIVQSATQNLPSGMKPDLTHIPSGHFTIGSHPITDPDRWLDEVQRPVFIEQPFLLARTQVTQAQYEQVMGINPSFFNGVSQRPIEMVSLLDAIRYCNALSEREGLEPYYHLYDSMLEIRGDIPLSRAGYRLPTEEEWEYAARANQKHSYAGSQQPAQVAWYAENSVATTHPVGLKEHNAWRLYDMSGNIFEWVLSPYQATYFGDVPDEAVRHDLNQEYVVRGGAWSSSVDLLRVSHRLAVPADWRTNYIGFRIARTQAG
jgi:formylglycine-generating enzyme required for sulfatase activity/tRNA A-37 threonylcarbamoyl transferase component Bud32